MPTKPRREEAMTSLLYYFGKLGKEQIILNEARLVS